MSAASQVNAYRPLGVLLGGPFAPQRSIAAKASRMRAAPQPTSDSPTLPVRCTRPAPLLSLRTERSAIMVDRYRKKIAAMVIQLAKDDPKFVKEMIQKLKRSGEIEADDLRYLERIADRWIRIAEENLQKARR